MKSVVVILLLTLVGACSSSKPQSDPPTASSPSSRPSSSPTSDPSNGAGSSSSACAEVRAGIDAFNQGNFDATVAHFRKALPLAQADAAKTDSTEADLLVEAVTYYADLAPSDYPSSSQSSSDFAKYKQITLGQCEGAGQEPSTQPESPGVTA